MKPWSEMTDRERDALVAEKVFDLKSDIVPHYSNEISAAWKVLEKLKTRDRYLTTYATMGDTHWVCQIYENGKIVTGAGSNSAPDAICLAALRLFGVEFEPSIPPRAETH